MNLRWGSGPVFRYEMIATARRRQLYAIRSGFVLILLVGMTIVWISETRSAAGPQGFRLLAAIGEGFFYALAGTQISLVMLAAPAAAAGSICVDRARGTLLHMMVTDLGDAEIVLGKLGSRVAPVFGLIACALPVTAIAALLGGVDFGALAGLFVVSLALAVLGCSLALSLSVWAIKTHEVLMAVYIAQACWLLSFPIWWELSTAAKFSKPPTWFEKANPIAIVFAPYYQPGLVTARDYTAFVAFALLVSALLLGFSVAFVRRVVVSGFSRGRSSRGGRWARFKQAFPYLKAPALDGNPVLWREWHHNRPSRLARILWTLLLCLIWALSAWGVYDLLHWGKQMGPNGLELGLLALVLFGFLMLSATAPTVLADERVRGSLEVLLATPMSTRSIVLAKWWGTYRIVLMLALLPTIGGILFAVTTPALPIIPPGTRAPWAMIPVNTWDRVFAAILTPADFLASGAMIVSLGLLLAIWVKGLGKAVTVSVIIYFLTVVGWGMLVDFGFSALVTDKDGALHRRYEWLITSVSALGPFEGPIAPLSLLDDWAWESRSRTWAGLGVVLLTKLFAAGAMLLLAIKTFDRRLGRTPELKRSDPIPKSATRPALAM